MRCPRCHATVLQSARFCPRCGHALASGADPATPGAAPGVPWAGILFLVGVLAGPAAVASGLLWSVPVLFYAGLAVSALIVLLVVMGLLF